MNKKSRIRKLFDNFTYGENPDRFFEFGSRPCFTCAHEVECGVDKSKHPIWAPAYGDEKSTVMLVAEAPSRQDAKWSEYHGPGPHVPGLFENWEIDEKKDKGLLTLRNFFKKQTGHWPYFTDLVKCGPANTQEKTVINKRAKHCMNTFLLEEIEIIDPTHIFCIGKMSYTELSMHQKDNVLKRTNGETIILINLLHYSPQANLPLKPKDKELIWRWQLGELATNEFSSKEPLDSLSFFHK